MNRTQFVRVLRFFLKATGSSPVIHYVHVWCIKVFLTLSVLSENKLNFFIVKINTHETGSINCSSFTVFQVQLKFLPHRTANS